MKFLPSLRQRDPRPQALPAPEPGLNADYYNTDITFNPAPMPTTMPTPSQTPRDLHRRHPHPPPFATSHNDYLHPRIVRGHRKPPTRYVKDPSAPIYFAPDPPTPETRMKQGPARHDDDYNDGHDAKHDDHHRNRHREPEHHAARRRSRRDHEQPARSPHYEYDYEDRPPRGRYHTNDQEPQQTRQRRSSRRESPTENDRPYNHTRRSRHHGDFSRTPSRSPSPSPSPSRSRSRHHRATASPHDRHQGYRRRHDPPSPPHPHPSRSRPHRAHEDDYDRRRQHPPHTRESRHPDRPHRHAPHVSSRDIHHRSPRPHPPQYRQHIKPTQQQPAAAFHRAMNSEWWKNPAVQAGAKTALNVGAHALMRRRKEDGAWLGSKGAKIAGAALGAALADGLGGEGKR